MSKRKTTEWTDRLEDAYTDTDRINRARVGELICMNEYRKRGIRVIDYASNKQKQIVGIDFSIQDKPHADECFFSVKANLTRDNQDLCIELEALEKCEADYQIHVNPETKHTITYSVPQMRIHLTQHCYPTVQLPGSKRGVWVAQEVAKALPYELPPN